MELQILLCHVCTGIQLCLEGGLAIASAYYYRSHQITCLGSEDFLEKRRINPDIGRNTLKGANARCQFQTATEYLEISTQVCNGYLYLETC